MKLKRRVYKRGASYEVTIPSSILFGLDLTKKHCVIFRKDQNKWSLRLEPSKVIKKDVNEIVRKLYRRGSSFETTLPIPLILELKTDASYNAVFTYDKKWFITFEEIDETS